MRSSTPLWGSMGSKLIKKSSSKNDISTSSTTLQRTSSDEVPQLKNRIEEEDYKGTITRSSLRRTLSRLSLNAPTITGRQTRERMFTSSSYKSSSSSSPKLGTIEDKSTVNDGEVSPKITSQFRLPRLQSFSPRLRLDLSDDEKEDCDNKEARRDLKSPISSSSKGGSMRSTTSNRTAKSISIPPTPSCSSPTFQFVFSSSIHSTNTAHNDETRYNELASLISIIELNPPQTRSPRISAPNTPSLTLKKSSFSLRRSIKLKNVATSPIISPSRTLLPHAQNTGVTVEKAPHPTISKREKAKTQRNRLIKPPKHLVEIRSYSFPPPSIILPPSEQSRLKSSKSLNDLLSTHTNILPTKRISIVSCSNSSSDATCVSYSEDSMIESSFPALCTPPRTPRSRHASIEWFVDFIANEDEKVDSGIQEIACDESTLMPDILGPPISLVSSRGRVEKGGMKDGGLLDEGGENDYNKRSSEAFDSLMDLIDSFPSPTVMSSSTFSSSASSSGISTSKVSSPSNSLWSFQHTIISSSNHQYSPSSTALVTPISEIGNMVNTPASSYFCHTPAHDDSINVGDKEGYGIEYEEGRGKDGRSDKEVNDYVLASHIALRDVLSADI